MKTLGVIANCNKPRAEKVLWQLALKAGELGIGLRASGRTAALLGVADEPLDDVLDSADAVIALGGDGTMLTAVRALGERCKPLLGVNIGSLGFMTSVAEEDLSAALQSLADESYIVSERVVADCTVRQAGEEPVTCHALNDVVITNGDSARVITLEVRIDGRPVTSYLCDGLIISTPTGSTGHSLSAGGPIVVPETPAFVISPICPHTLSSRPLVVPDSCVIEVAVGSQSDVSRLTLDGQLQDGLVTGDSLTVRRRACNVRFLHLPDYDYFDVLRRKLNWRGSSMSDRA